MTEFKVGDRVKIKGSSRVLDVIRIDGERTAAVDRETSAFLKNDQYELVGRGKLNVGDRVKWLTSTGTVTGFGPHPHDGRDSVVVKWDAGCTGHPRPEWLELVPTEPPIKLKLDPKPENPHRAKLAEAGDRVEWHDKGERFTGVVKQVDSKDLAFVVVDECCIESWRKGRFRDADVACSGVQWFTVIEPRSESRKCNPNCTDGMDSIPDTGFPAITRPAILAHFANPDADTLTVMDGDGKAVAYVVGADWHRFLDSLADMVLRFRDDVIAAERAFAVGTDGD